MRIPTATSINVAGRLTQNEKMKTVYRNFHAPAAERSLNCRRIRSRTFILNFRRNEPGMKKNGRKKEERWYNGGFPEHDLSAVCCKACKVWIRGKVFSLSLSSGNLDDSRKKHPCVLSAKHLN